MFMTRFLKRGEQVVICERNKPFAELRLIISALPHRVPFKTQRMT